MGRKDQKRPKAAGSEHKRKKSGESDWADEAAKARTADDPRAVAPHDRAGRPSTDGTR